MIAEIDDLDFKKAGIMETILGDHPEITVGDLNDLLLTRQAILFKFLMDKSRLIEFHKFVERHKLQHIYNHNKLTEPKKKIRKSVLKQFGMSDMEEVLAGKGYGFVE